MLSARVRDQLRVTGRRLREGTFDLWGKLHGIAVQLRAASNGLKVGFGISLGVYLIIKLVGVVVHLPPAMDLAVLPAGVCALGLAVSARGAKAQEEAEASEQTIAPGLLAGAVLLVFTMVYLAVNTVPMITAQDESATVYGGRALATEGSLRVTSPLNDRYHTNVIGELHATYRTSTQVYYRTFPGTAVLYAPFSVLPQDLGYRLFTMTFGSVTIVALYFAAWKLLRSWWGGLVGALVFAVSPAFGHWAVTVFNNVPALALELSALAIVLWSPRQGTWRFGLAGALMSLAFFTRITELVYVVPVFVLVFWRTRRLLPIVAFGAAGLAGVALVAVTNQLFYGDPLFLPNVGSPYVLFVPGSQPASSGALLKAYAQFSTGGQGTVSAAALPNKVSHLWFHFRYLASSTFAFPFLPLAFVGLTWRVLAGKRDIWLLVVGIFTVTLSILLIYGQKYNNYYGFGLPIVRSSFVRYSLPIYALVAVAAGAFFLDTSSIFRTGTVGAMLPIALIGIVVTVGVAHSYDADVYGFNRLNGYRQDDRAAWSKIEAFLDTSKVTPLVIGGTSAEKLIDSKYERYFINYDGILPAAYRMPVIIPVAQQAARERDVYLIASDVNQDDKKLMVAFNTIYRPQDVLRVGEFHVLRLRLDPASYTLAGVDVWNTDEALDRWSVTADGYLKTIADNAYVQLLSPLDVNGDGRVDQDVTVEFAILDSGPPVATISELNSDQGGQPAGLWSAPLLQTATWRTATFTLKKGDMLQGLFALSSGVTIRSIKIVAASSDQSGSHSLSYTLAGVDVWNTYQALDRWSVTADEYLKTTADNAYAQLLSPVDADGDGRVDQDVTVEFEVLDAGPAVAAISGLNSAEDGQPVILWSAPLLQTGIWRTAAITLKKGDRLQGLFALSSGVTIRSIKIVATGSE
jgi:hypothetical protein